MNTVRVLFFGKLADLVTESEFRQQIESGTLVSDVYEKLARQYPLQPLAQKPNIKVAVNRRLSDWDQPLSPGDELAFLPPVTGG